MTMTVYSVVLSTNQYNDPIINVDINNYVVGKNGLKDCGALFRKSTYTVSAMLDKVRASRRVLVDLCIKENEFIPDPEVTDTLDEIIEQLLCLQFMIGECGSPFVPELFSARFGVSLPYTANTETRQLVKRYLLR